jgi:pescadillo protein
LRACGAEVGWPREGSPFEEDAENVTHQIVDRPLAQVNVRPGREYIQPQWVFDCVNEGRVLPIAEYAPGLTPPPHLSPFVDHEAEGYVPERRAELSKLADDAEDVEEDAGDEEPENMEELAQAEIEAEAEGRPSSEKVALKTTSRKAKANAEKAEEEERLKSMMTKKHKRMLLRINQREATKGEKVSKLVEKRAKLGGKAK